MKLDHIALIISNLDNLSFYEKLGFTETKRINRKYDTVVFMQRDEIVLEIFVDSNHPEKLISPEAQGLRHVAFAVNNLNPILEKFDYNKIDKDWLGRKVVYINDPDNQPIEIVEVK